MQDESLLTEEQSSKLLQDFKSPVCFDAAKAQSIVTLLTKEYTDPFGGAYRLSPVTIDYFKELYWKRINT